MISADEKSQLQALRRRHRGLPPGPGRTRRVEFEYRRGGTLAYFAAYDVHRAQVLGRIAPKTGIEPFTDLVAQVMTTEPYASARRVFWVVDNGSSHIGQRSIDQMSTAWPTATLVHLPVHASWLNQVEIFFSILQRKGISRSDFADLDHLAERVLAFQERYNTAAEPFDWTYTRDDLNAFLRRLGDRANPDHQHTAARPPTNWRACPLDVEGWFRSRADIEDRIREAKLGAALGHLGLHLRRELHRQARLALARLGVTGGDLGTGLALDLVSVATQRAGTAGDVAEPVVSALPAHRGRGLAHRSRHMSVHKLTSGRYRAKLKSGRQDVASRVFDTKREALAWLARERAALAGGVDPRAGRQRVRILLSEWLDIRRSTVAAKTYRTDQDLLRLVPTSIQALHVAAVSDREIARSFDRLLATGLAEASVQRYRASLSAFFGWCVREKLILTNPVTAVRVPKQSAETTEIQPFTEDQLEAAYTTWQAYNPQLADVLLVLAWTGLRWAEARALTVADVMQIPTPGLLVRRSAPEGIATKSTKGRRSRRVPVANRVLPIIEHLAETTPPDQLLLTTATGARLHRSAVLRSVNWTHTGQGRRLHDLRHTAACLWLSRGVDPGTVQAWMGHESIATTNRYLHHLGTGADEAGLARLNATPGGTRGAHKGGAR